MLVSCEGWLAKRTQFECGGFLRSLSEAARMAEVHTTARKKASRCTMPPALEVKTEILDYRASVRDSHATLMRGSLTLGEGCGGAHESKHTHCRAAYLARATAALRGGLRDGQDRQ